MKLIVGLGNPGRKYEGTRHNIGWMVLDELKRRHATGAAQARFHGQLTEVRLGDVRSCLLAPHTFMNRSGTSVAAAKSFYKIADEDLLVICDDFQLPLAKLRIRPSGSAGGQQGLADVIRALGHQNFARLRIGIGSPPPHWDAADYVLSRFGGGEQEERGAAVGRAADAVEVWATAGIGPCMNQYN
ncbi:MAG: aminoacyl-tRNA hydrolase [Planctomycetales bacterium]|nr:aminoacyl-tRNA hydrolase [Planctomycetales bacterium]